MLNFIRKLPYVSETSRVFLPQLIQSIMSFLLVIVATRILSTDQYGSYQYILSICGTLMFMALPGYVTAMIASIAKKNHSSYERTLMYRLKGSMLASIMLLCLAGYYYGKNDLWYVVLTVALLYPFVYGFDLGHHLLLALQKWSLYSRWMSVYYLSIFSVLLCSVVYFRSGMVLTITYFLCFAVANFIIYSKAKKYLSNDRFDQNLKSNGAYYSVAEALSYVTAYIDKVLVGSLIGLSVLAVYTVAQSLVGQIRLVLKPLTRIFLPKFSKHSDKTFVRRRIVFRLPLLILSNITVVLLLYITSRLILAMFFTQDFSAAKTYIFWLGLSYIFIIPIQIIRQFLMACELKHIIIRLTMIVNISKLLLIALIVPFGISGLLAGLILHHIFTFILHLYYLFSIDNKMLQR